MGNHIDANGKFQSDKYPTCPPDKVPLSVNDPTAQDLLWEYAQRRRKVDAEFSDDLELRLIQVGYRSDEAKALSYRDFMFECSFAEGVVPTEEELNLPVMAYREERGPYAPVVGAVIIRCNDGLLRLIVRTGAPGK